MADVIQFPDHRSAGDRESERLTTFLEGVKLPARRAAELGSLEDWAWTAVGYLKVIQSNCAGSGRALVSMPAVAIMLAYLEELAGRCGIIPPPPTDPEVA